MRKLLVVLPLVLGLVGCSAIKKIRDYIKSRNSSKSLYAVKFNTTDLRPFADFSWVRNKKIPSVKELGDDYLDIRHVDCSNKDLSGYNPQKISFDYGTVFPKDNSKLPKNFDINQILEVHKNPGLSVRKLHKMGIDGAGVSMAIIDSQLAPHQEYNDNVMYYEEFLDDQLRSNSSWGNDGNMHGSAVSSIAVGKTVGVAPKAKLYYFAADIIDQQPPHDGELTHEEETKIRTSKHYAQALRKILDINKSLPDNQKIVVVSISASPSWSKDSEIWDEVLKQAKEEGVFVTTTRIEKEYGLSDNGANRDVFLDPDAPNSYSQASWQKGQNPSKDIQKKTLCFPMDHRTTAAPNGEDHYVHYANGGWSWMKPFEAGIYVLAKQLNPKINPEEFFRIGLKTGTYSEKAKCVLINPVAFIEEVKNDF